MQCFQSIDYVPALSAYTCTQAFHTSQKCIKPGKRLVSTFVPSDSLLAAGNLDTSHVCTYGFHFSSPGSTYTIPHLKGGRSYVCNRYFHFL